MQDGSVAVCGKVCSTQLSEWSMQCINLHLVHYTCILLMQLGPEVSFRAYFGCACSTSVPVGLLPPPMLPAIAHNKIQL